MLSRGLFMKSLKTMPHFLSVSLLWVNWMHKISVQYIEYNLWFMTKYGKGLDVYECFSHIICKITEWKLAQINFIPSCQKPSTLHVDFFLFLVRSTICYHDQDTCHYCFQRSFLSVAIQSGKETDRSGDQPSDQNQERGQGEVSPDMFITFTLIFTRFMHIFS